ncbi:MAG: hypothetical protein JWQ49_4321 [Edaphobacter sp.]|jgi:hypothetical protein|nr:hypothetical protein [Edaphobacter sp.]
MGGAPQRRTYTYASGDRGPRCGFDQANLLRTSGLRYRAFAMCENSLLVVRFRPQEKAMRAGRVIELSNDLPG